MLPKTVRLPWRLLVLVSCGSVINLLVPLVKFFALNLSGFRVLEEPHLLLLSLFVYFCQYCTRLLLVCAATNLPSFIKKKANFGFLTAFLPCLVAIDIFLNCRELQAGLSHQRRLSAQGEQISQFHRRQLFEVVYAEEGEELSNSEHFTLAKRLQFDFASEFFPVLMVALPCIILIIYAVVYWREISHQLGLRFAALEPRCAQLGCRTARFIGLCAFSAAYVAVFVVYLAFPLARKSALEAAAPPAFFLIRASIFPVISAGEEERAVRLLRSRFDPPAGFGWLPGRYAAVLAEDGALSAYGRPGDGETRAGKVPAGGRPPNVVLLVLESFTPSPYYFDDAFVAEDDRLYSGPLYNAAYLPNLARLQRQGVAVAAAASQSYPTNGGWFGLLSGAYQLRFGADTINQFYNDMDDVPSFFVQKGYWSYFVAPSDPAIDQQSQYVFRGNKVLSGPKELQKLPRWFHLVQHNLPTDEQYERLGIAPRKTNKDWYPDRITQRQLVYQFEEAKALGRPIFAHLITTETHRPYDGYDDAAYYERSFDGKPYNWQNNIDRYSNTLKYADKYLGEAVDNITRLDSNTVFIITGDHGASTLHSYRGHNCRQHVMDQRCFQGAYGGDEQLTVSGMLYYAGDDPFVKSKFDAVRGKTWAAPASHADLIFTVQKLISDYTGEYLVTGRLGRDIFQLLKDNVTGKYINLRQTGYFLEVATENTLTRTNYLSNKNGIVISNAIYPTCVSGKQYAISKLARAEFEEYLLLSELLEKLSKQNRLFNYNLRDQQCIREQNCKMTSPTVGHSYYSPVAVILLVVIPTCWMLFFLLLQCLLTCLFVKKLESYECQKSKYGFSLKPAANEVDKESFALTTSEA